MLRYSWDNYVVAVLKEKEANDEGLIFHNFRVIRVDLI